MHRERGVFLLIQKFSFIPKQQGRGWNKGGGGGVDRGRGGRGRCLGGFGIGR